MLFLTVRNHKYLVGKYFKIEQYVHLLNDKCSKIDHTSLIPSSLSNTISDRQLSKFTLVSSIKILTETRRRCWMCLEENNFAAAAR